MIKLLSVVTTAYRSEATLEVFVKRALAAAGPLACAVELVIVDDGSPDRSAELVRRLADEDERIMLVQLSRNFGHHRALLAGLEHASGDVVFLIDSDLEETPENLIAMLELMQQVGADCVYGVQRERKGGWFERISGKLFYDLFGLLSEVKLPRNVSTMRLMSHRYVKSLLLFRDHNPVFVPLSLLTGYKQTAFEFDKNSSSKTTYSVRRRVSLMLLAVTSFSGRPLYLMFAMSIVFSILGLTYMTVVLVQALMGTVLDGWSSIMAALLLFFSINALFTGIIGLYVKHLLEEVKDRPRTIVQEVYRRLASTEDAES